MTTPKRRRLVGTFDSTDKPKTFHAERPEEQNPLVAETHELQDREGVRAARSVQPQHENAGEGADAEENEPLPELGPLEALTNEQIEERLRKLAGPSLDLLEKLVACGTSGRKLPRNVQAAIGNAQWVISAARATKAPQAAENEKARAAKLEHARKTLGGAALTAELQKLTRAERSGTGDAH